MFRKLLAVVVCGVVATPLFMGTAPAAVSEVDRPTQAVFRDGPGDVWMLNLKTHDPYPIGDFPRADVTRALVAHRARAVVFRSRFVDLRRVGDQEYRFNVRTGGPEGWLNFFTAVLISEPGDRAGRLGFWGDDAGSESCTAANARKWRGFTGSIDYATDVVQIRIPRRCLHFPRWIRAGVMNSMTLPGADKLAYGDNAMDHAYTEGPAPQTVRLYHP